LSFPEVKSTEVFRQKKTKEMGGEISAPRAFVESIISNQPRGEESLYTVHCSLV